MFGLSIWELLIVLVIVILVFGPKRLGTIGSDLGNAIKGFRTAIKDDSAEATADAKPADSAAKESVDQKSNV